MKPSKHWNIKKKSPEVSGLINHFKSVVKSCVQLSFKSYRDATSVANFKSLPNKEQCKDEGLLRPGWMERVEFYYGRKTFFLNQFWQLSKLMARTDKDLDKMRRNVWGLDPEEWLSDGDEKDEEEPAEASSEESQEDQPDQSDDGVDFELTQPFLPGDDRVYYR